MFSSQLKISQYLFGRYWHFPSKRLPALWKSRLVLHELLFWSLFTDLQRCLGQGVCGGHGKSSACSASVGFSYPLMKAVFFSLSAFFSTDGGMFASGFYSWLYQLNVPSATMAEPFWCLKVSEGLQLWISVIISLKIMLLFSKYCMQVSAVQHSFFFRKVLQSRWYTN